MAKVYFTAMVTIQVALMVILFLPMRSLVNFPMEDDTGHIRISGKLTGFLAAVAGHDLIAAILTAGRTIAGWVTPLSLDAGHHSPHFFIIPDFKGMVLEGVEFVQLDIDDLLLAPAWSIPLAFRAGFRAGAACIVGAVLFSGSFLTAFSGFCARGLWTSSPSGLRPCPYLFSGDAPGAAQYWAFRLFGSHHFSPLLFWSG